MYFGNGLVSAFFSRQQVFLRSGALGRKDFADIMPRVKERVGEDGGGGRWTRSLVFRWYRGCEMGSVVGGGVVEEGIHFSFLVIDEEP